MPLHPREIEKGFKMIEHAALNGERCPTNISMDNPSGTLRAGITSQLLKEGRIRVEVYPQNWRVIEIVKGPHAGRRTQGPPKKEWRPYKILP